MNGNNTKNQPPTPPLEPVSVVKQKGTIAETILSELNKSSTKNTPTISALKRSTDSSAYARMKSNRMILRRVLAQDLPSNSEESESIARKKRKLMTNQLLVEIEKEKSELKRQANMFRKEQTKYDSTSRRKTVLSNSISNTKTMFECARLQARYKLLATSDDTTTKAT